MTVLRTPSVPGATDAGPTSRAGLTPAGAVRMVPSRLGRRAHGATDRGGPASVVCG